MGRLPRLADDVRAARPGRSSVTNATLCELWRMPPDAKPYAVRQATAENLIPGLASLANEAVYVPTGWRGPYIASFSSGTNLVDGVAVPHLSTKYEGRYRVVYCEHCADERSGAPIYRRLLLMAAQEPTRYDEWSELQPFTGNRRNASATGEPLDVATGAVNTYDESKGLFFMELLNFDTVYR